MQTTQIKHPSLFDYLKEIEEYKNYFEKNELIWFVAYLKQLVAEKKWNDLKIARGILIDGIRAIVMNKGETGFELLKKVAISKIYAKLDSPVHIDITYMINSLFNNNIVSNNLRVPPNKVEVRIRVNSKHFGQRGISIDGETKEIVDGIDVSSAERFIEIYSSEIDEVVMYNLGGKADGLEEIVVNILRHCKRTVAKQALFYYLVHLFAKASRVIMYRSQVFTKLDNMINELSISISKKTFHKLCNTYNIGPYSFTNYVQVILPDNPLAGPKRITIENVRKKYSGDVIIDGVYLKRIPSIVGTAVVTLRSSFDSLRAFVYDVKSDYPDLPKIISKRIRGYVVLPMTYDFTLESIFTSVPVDMIEVIET